MPQEPLHPLFKGRQALDDFIFQNLNGEERNNSDHRTDGDTAEVTMKLACVVKEAVRFIPQAVTSKLIHCVCDSDIVLKELRGDVFISGVLAGQLQRNREHRETIKRHPGRAIGLRISQSWRELHRAIKQADVVQSQKAACEEVLPVNVLPVNPPREIDEELLKNPLEKEPVPLTVTARHLVNAPTCPGVHWRIHIRQPELVGGERTAGVHVPFPQQKNELLLRKLRIDLGKRDHLKCVVPGGEPGVLPFIRHRQNIAAVQVSPLAIPACQPICRWCRLRRIACQPVLHDILVKLFRPEETRIRLPCHALLFFG